MSKIAYQEFDLIKSLKNLSHLELPECWLGIGDDCAFIPSDALSSSENGSGTSSGLILSVDTQIENVHFRRSYFDAADIGWRSLSVAVSDIAAMGGAALGCLVSLQCPSELSADYLREVYRGLHEAAEQFGCPLLGGDTVRSDTFAVSVTVVGTVKDGAIFRNGAQGGDDIWLSGELGGAFLGFGLLEQSSFAEHILDEVDQIRVTSRHLRPSARVSLGKLLSLEGLAHSLIDVSDGILADAFHLSEASGVGFVFDWSSIPVDSLVSEDTVSKIKAITHGDDYELLFTAPKSVRSRIEELAKSTSDGNLPVLSRIGDVVAGSTGVELVVEGRCTPVGEFLRANGQGNLGYTHF